MLSLPGGPIGFSVKDQGQVEGHGNTLYKGHLVFMRVEKGHLVRKDLYGYRKDIDLSTK